MIITVDGLDGAGKTTLAKKISKHFGYEYLDKPVFQLCQINKTNFIHQHDIMTNIHNSIYTDTDSDILKSYFTGLGLLYVKECMGNQNIVIDRGLLSAYSYNGNEKTNLIFETLIKLGLWFDYSILLTLSDNERINRLKKRNINDPDLLLNNINELKYELIKEFLNKHPELPILIINTNTLNEDEVFNIAIDAIDKKLATSSPKLVKKR